MTFQEVKEGGSTGPPARRVGRADDNVHDVADNDGTRRPETNATEVENSSPQRGAKHGGGIKPKPTAALKKRENAAMSRVRQDIRQPVTSLWQTVAERASTAPTACHGGGIVDCTNSADRLSRRRPHSRIGAARTKREIGRSDATDGVVDGCLQAGGRGALSSADEEKRSSSRGRPSRERQSAFTDTNTKTPGLVPTRGSGGRVVEAQPARRTPAPLRSSHRVGPVGKLGGW